MAGAGLRQAPEIGEAVQARLRETGLAATIVVLTDDEAGDAGLIRELADADADARAVAAGGDSADRSGT